MEAKSETMAKTYEAGATRVMKVMRISRLKMLKLPKYRSPKGGKKFQIEMASMFDRCRFYIVFYMVQSDGRISDTL